MTKRAGFRLSQRLGERATQRRSSLDALLIRASQCVTRREYEQARVLFEQLLKFQPAHLEGLIQYGNLCLDLKMFESAATYYERALNVKADAPAVLNDLGIAELEQGKYEQAIGHLKQAIELKLDYPEAHNNLGLVYERMGHFDLAQEQYAQAIELRPTYPEALNNRGVIYMHHELYEEAKASYDLAIKSRPDYPEALNNRGIALKELCLFDKSIEDYRWALELMPRYYQAYNNLAIAYQDEKELDLALEAIDAALEIAPDYPEAYNNRGNILLEKSRLQESVENYDVALALNPVYPEAWGNKGIPLRDMGQLEESLRHFSRAMELKPSIPYLLGNFAFTKMLMSIWDGVDPLVDNLREKVLGGARPFDPFSIFAFSDDPEVNFHAAKSWTTKKFTPLLNHGPIQKTHHKKIKIAYFSADFRYHPVAFLTAEMFEIHDREKFEVYAFSLQGASESDEVRARLVNAFDHFIDVQDKSDRQITNLARELEIDIAIDLGGHTQHSRPGIFARRAAPVQINFLGYPGTMGAPYMDYIVADPTLIPPENRQFFAEKVIYLPHTYMVDDSQRQPSQRVFTRAECGLPEYACVFCCFNNGYKFNLATITMWSQILRAVPGSVLWISANNKIFQGNFLSEFAKLGISAERIIFAKRMDLLNDHLARFKLADLFLDTLPYNAHTTAVDALKAGVPLLTLIGKAFAGRVAASLLNTVGMPELIVHSRKAYVEKAIELGQNLQNLNEIRTKLQVNINNKPLFDSQLFTHHLEDAYLKAFGRWQQDLAPEEIFIKSRTSE